MSQRTILKYTLLSFIVIASVYPSACISWGIKKPSPTVPSMVPVIPSSSPSPTN